MIASRLDVQVESVPGDLNEEVRADQAGQGLLIGRSLQAISADRDRFLFDFDKHEGFRKPSPFEADPFCVCTGSAQVLRGDLIEFGKRLELRWHEQVLRLFAIRAGQPMLLDEEGWTVSRMRVLIGIEIEGVHGDVASNIPKKPVASWPSDLRLKDEGGMFDLDFSNGNSEWVEGIEWLRQHTLLSVAMSGLRLLFDAPNPVARQRLVQVVAEDYLADVGAYVNCLHRFSVHVSDAARRLIVLHIEVTPHGGIPRSWEREFELPEADLRWVDGADAEK